MVHAHGKIGFSQSYAKSVDKQTFVEHFKEVYPGVNLEAEYDKLVPADKAAPVKKVVKKGKK